MSIETIRAEAHELLAQARRKVGMAEKRLASGTDAQRVAAAGQLAVLNHRVAEWEGRVRALDHAPEEVASNLIQGLREEGFLLMQNIEDWIAGG